MLKKLHYSIKYQEETGIVLANGAADQIADIFLRYRHTSYVLFMSKTTDKLFADKIKRALLPLKKPINIFVIDGTEESKNMDTLTKLLSFMKGKGVDKKGCLVALGGGVISDIATVAAGLFYRGIDAVIIPTTLLSQVDAAIGGKGAVDMGNHKNTIGITRQPKIIIIDPLLLKTLPKSQQKSGMGEVLKYAIAMDKELFEKLTEKEKLADDDIAWIIERCIKLKMDIVEKDPLDKTGIRQTVNFGHTLGHAIERTAKLSHGEAIAVGMVFAVRLSKALGLLSQQEMERSLALIKKYNLPTVIKNVEENQIVNLMFQDKKATTGRLNFVLLAKIGQALTNQTVEEKTVRKVLQEVIL